MSWTRRRFNTSSGIMLASVFIRLGIPVNAGVSLSAYGENAIPANLQHKNSDDWIQEWMNAAKINKSLEGAFRLQRFKDPFYILLDPIHWSLNKKCCIPSFTVPKGFVTDFASVPKVFWSLFPRDGNYAYAATIHDYLYWQQDRSKLESDLIFRYAMDDLKITDNQSFFLYKAVDLFGQKAWDNNAALKKSGEKRVLQVFPSLPTIEWAEWKQRPDVFE